MAGHKAIVSLSRTAFPDQWWQIEDLIVEGDKIVARTTMTGTHQSDFSGIPPTGRSNIAIFRDRAGTRLGSASAGRCSTATA